MADTFPNPAWPADATIQALNGTTDQGTGLPYVATGVSPSSTPPLAIQVDRLHRRLTNILNIENQLRLVQEDAGLTYGVYPGDYRFSDGTYKHFAGSTAQTLTNDATNSIYINASNILVSSVGGFPADLTTFVPIAEVVTAGGLVSSIADKRGRARTVIPANTTSSATGTNDVNFILDEDNAGAGADSMVRFNRGTDDAEDGAVMYDVSANRVEVRTQHATGTLAPLNSLAVYINGALALDSTGAALVQSAVAGAGLSHAAGVLSVQTSSAAGTQISGGTVAVDPSDGITVDTNGVAVSITSNHSLELSSGSAGSRTLQAKVDNATLEADATNGLQLKDSGIDGTKHANLSANGTAVVLFEATLAGGNTVVVHNANAPFKYRVVDAWSVAASAAGGTWFIDDGTTPITNSVAVTAIDKTVDRVGTIDDATHEILLAGTMRVVGDGSLANCKVYISAVAVA